MGLAEEIIEQAYIHAQSTGKTPDTLRISRELWQELQNEYEDRKMLVEMSDDELEKVEEDRLRFNGMDVTVVDAGEFFRYALQ